MEQIKQEIINNIYENGENLITGPVLQTVLLDMVDDVNSKVASASVAPDIVDKTGSWDDAADWVEENSSSLVHENDLDGYATEQWVEDQGYLKEHQDLGGYATTESLNDLSESVANDLANLPEPDLSDYATKEYVEATSASVKEWVENKHYLTTASLSGSVTEESVQFMINDATSSVKTWVGDQNYATETFVSQAIAEIPGTDLTGYATEQWVEEQGYLKEHQDISGLATTQSVTSLSESVASLGEEISSIWDTTDNLSGDITSLSESVARDLENYVQERDLTSLSESVSSDLESKADDRKVNNLSESVAQDFANLNIPDVSGYATTSSVNQLSESIAQTIEDLPQADLSGYLQTSSYLVDSASFDQRISEISGSDLSGYATTESVNTLSASFAETIDNIPGTDLTGYATEQWVQNQGYLTEHQDISGLATTSSLNSVSQSLSASIAAITGSAPVDYVTTSSFNALSESVVALSESVDGYGIDLLWSATNALEGEGIIEWNDESEEYTAIPLATSESVGTISESLSRSIEDLSSDVANKANARDLTSLSESVADDFANLEIPDVSGYATTQSVNALSASFDQRLLSASGLTYQDLNDLGLVYDTDGEGNWSARLVPEEGTGSFDEEAPAIWRLLRDKNFIGVEEDENGWRISYILESGEWIDNPVGKFLDAISEGKLATLELPEGAEQDIWVSPIVREVESLSASVAAMTGSSADLSGYATTASVNQLSSSVATDILNARTEASAGFASVNQGVVALSASFDQRINSITASGGVDSGYLWTSGSGLKAVQMLRRDTSAGGQLYARGSSSLALNYGTSANGVDSIAAGHGSTANGWCSVTFGEWTKAQNDHEVAIGKLNWSESGSGQKFSIGIGDQGQALNAISYIYDPLKSYDGGLYIYGIGGYQGKDTGSAKSLKEVIDSIETSYITTASYLVDSASFDSRINSLDLSGFLFGTGSASGSESIFPSASNWVVEVSQSVAFILDSELEEGRSIQVIYHNAGANSVNVYFNEEYWGPYSVVNGVLGSGSFEIPTGEYGDVVATRIGDRVYFRTSLDVSNIEVDLSEYATTESVNTLSASFDQRINSIPGSDIDLSEYATTESVNTLSASFAETIDNIPTGSSGNYLPTTGGTLTGTLKVNASVGVGTNPLGVYSLAVGDSSTNTNNAHYALAVGENCSTDVYGGVALGRETRVNSEPFGVAVGFRTRVDKMSGFAGGCLTTASGQFSFAAGFGAVSKGTGQVVLGSFNEIDGTGTGTGSYAVILGNGKSSTWNQDNPGDVVRSNGLAIKWDGGVDINYSGSTITLQNKIAELEATIAGLVARIEALEGSN